MSMSTLRICNMFVTLSISSPFYPHQPSLLPLLLLSSAPLSSPLPPHTVSPPFVSPLVPPKAPDMRSINTDYPHTPTPSGGPYCPASRSSAAPPAGPLDAVRQWDLQSHLGVISVLCLILNSVLYTYSISGLVRKF